MIGVAHNSQKWTLALLYGAEAVAKFFYDYSKTVYYTMPGRSSAVEAARAQGVGMNFKSKHFSVNNEADGSE